MWPVTGIPADVLARYRTSHTRPRRRDRTPPAPQAGGPPGPARPGPCGAEVVADSRSSGFGRNMSCHQSGGNRPVPLRPHPGKYPPRRPECTAAGKGCTTRAGGSHRVARRSIRFRLIRVRWLRRSSDHVPEPGHLGAEGSNRRADARHGTSRVRPRPASPRPRLRRRIPGLRPLHAGNAVTTHALTDGLVLPGDRAQSDILNPWYPGHVTPLWGACSSPCCIPLLPRINDHLVRWAMRKYKRLRRREKRARLFLSGRRQTRGRPSIRAGAWRRTTPPGCGVAVPACPAGWTRSS